MRYRLYRLWRNVDLPPGWLLAFALLAWGQSRLWPGPELGAWADLLGWGLVGVAVLLALAAIAQFVLLRTTLVPRHDPSQLVTSGVYALSRNPIYLADVLLLIGLSLIWSSVGGVILVPLFIYVIQNRFIRGEETRIAEIFGTSFQDYCKKVRRWI